MTINGFLQIAVYIIILVLLVKPLGLYMAHVYQGEHTFIDPVLRPVERFLYRLMGVRPDEEMDWKTYTIAMLLFTLAGQEVSLTPTEYDLLRVLVQHAGKVMTHHQLLRLVWGTAYEAETHLLRVNMSNLRRKIEPDPTRPHFILTEPGVGYRLRAEA